MKKILFFALLLGSGGAASAQQQIEAYGRVFYHRDGQCTRTQKRGDNSEVRQETYNKEKILTETRVFKVDEAGRLRNGVIYDGRKNPVGSTRYYYDPNSNQLLMEELFNKNGDLVRKLYYPGALKDPRFAKRMVAFSFDPNQKNAGAEGKGVEIRGAVRPIVPVTSNQDTFEPGMAQGAAAPTPQEAAAAQAARSRGGAAGSPTPAAAAGSGGSPAATTTIPKKKSWFKQKQT